MKASDAAVGYGGTSLAALSAIVARTATQSIPSGTWTPIAFTTIEQVNGALVSGSNITTITIPAGGAGEYDVFYTASWGVSTSGARRQARLVRNGTEVVLDSKGPPATSSQATANIIATRLRCAAGDTLSIETLQDSGVTTNVGTGGTDQVQFPRLSVARVAA